MGWIATESN